VADGAVGRYAASSPSSPEIVKLRFAVSRLLGDVAKWPRQGSAKPRPWVRFPPSPQRIFSNRARRAHTHDDDFAKTALSLARKAMKGVRHQQLILKPRAA